jgi:hypothetical protein
MIAWEGFDASGKSVNELDMRDDLHIKHMNADFI